MSWGLGFAGWFHLGFFGLAIPLGAFRSRKLIRDKPTSSAAKDRLLMVVVQLLVFLAISLAVAAQEWIWIFARAWPRPRDWVLAVAMLTAALLFMRTRWRKAVREQPEIVSLFAPRTGTERAWWVLVALAAGVGEEITWRCVQFELLRRWIGEPVLAVVACSLMFALAHAIQGWKSVLAIVGFAFGFHALVLTSGSIYTAIVVHFVYDVIAGLIYGHLLNERDRLALAQADATLANRDDPPVPTAGMSAADSLIPLDQVDLGDPGSPPSSAVSIQP